MVTDFEEIRAQVDVMIDQLGFACHPRIAHEERGERLSFPRVRQARNDAVLIDVVARVDERHIRRRENVERNAVVGRPVPAPMHDSNGHVPSRSGALAVDVGTPSIGLARVEDFSDRKLRDNTQAAADMIA
ncbi:MAG: hypothetical protein ABSB70_20125 [Candidatus Velthaea sp.]